MNEHNLRVDHICAFGSPKFTNEQGSTKLSQQLPLTLVEHAFDPIVKISFPTLNHPFGNKKYAELNPRTLVVLEPIGINKQIHRLIQASHSLENARYESNNQFNRVNSYRAGSRQSSSNNGDDELESYKALLFHGMKCSTKAPSRNSHASLMKFECHYMKSYVNALQSLIQVEQPEIRSLQVV